MKKQVGFPRGAQVTAGIMGLFGLITLVASSSLLFNFGGVSAEAGNTVPVVLWMNFFASFLYLIAAYGLFTGKGWTPGVLAIAIVLMGVAAIGFYYHAQNGGAYEQRTIGALSFRIFVTALLYLAARYYTRRSNQSN
ncbi:MAG: hypothetical protein ABIQ75_07055 [Flavobacteriales bacterium]